MPTTLSKAGHTHTNVTQAQVVHGIFVSSRYSIRIIRYRADSSRDVGLEMDRRQSKDCGLHSNQRRPAFAASCANQINQGICTSLHFACIIN